MAAAVPLAVAMTTQRVQEGRILYGSIWEYMGSWGGTLLALGLAIQIQKMSRLEQAHCMNQDEFLYISVKNLVCTV